MDVMSFPLRACARYLFFCSSYRLPHQQWLILSLLLTGLLTGCDNYKVTVYKPEKVWDSYTLPTGALGGFSPIIDMKGNLVTRFRCNGFPAKLLPDGSVVCHSLKTGALEVPELRQVAPDGTILWRFRDWSRNSAKQHHDFQFSGGNPVGYYVPGMEMTGPADGGHMLVLAHYLNKMSMQDIRLGRLLDDVLYEIDPAGNILWEWHAKDHIDEMGFSDSALKDIHFEPLSSDWLHVNTVSYIGPNKWYAQGDARFHPDNIIIASPRARWIAIIDHLSGHFVWRLGPDYSESNPGAEFGGVNFPHHAHIIPQGLPGAGNLLVFDNGTFSGFGDQYTPGRLYSRVLEINPIDASVVWEYRGNLFSLNMSSAQRLPNGNTFITEGLKGKMLEVTAEKEVVWEARGLPLYRAYRVPKEWVKPSENYLPLAKEAEQ